VKISIFVLAPAIKKRNTEESTVSITMEIVKASDSPKLGIDAEAPVVEDINNEEHAGPINRDVVERNDIPEAEAMPCTPVRMQAFPIQYSPFVTKGRGSSSRRSHCKCCI
jgi:hypothetical protein